MEQPSDFQRNSNIKIRIFYFPKNSDATPTVSRGVAALRPLWRRPAVLPLPRGHVQLVPGPLQDLFDLKINLIAPIK